MLTPIIHQHTPDLKQRLIDQRKKTLLSKSKRKIMLAGLGSLVAICHGPCIAENRFLPDAIITHKQPTRTPARHAVDTPLLGNGDMKVTWSGSTAEQHFHLGKNDLWRLKHGYHQSSPLTFGTLILSSPELDGATIQQTQALDYPALHTQINKGEIRLNQRSIVCAHQNTLWIQLEVHGGAITITPTLTVKSGRDSLSIAEKRQGILFAQRSFDEQSVDIPSGVAVAVSTQPGVTGKQQNPSSTTNPTTSVAGEPLTLNPGKPVNLYVCMDSLFDSPDYSSRVIQQAKNLSDQDPQSMEQAHRDWWQRYWQQSWIKINDTELESGYYRALYSMAACSRNRTFPPGIFGWDTTDEPRWHGDYHLNYNHYAPFYGLYSSNRLEQAVPQDAPLTAFRHRGQWYAKKVTNTGGVLFPVGIGPCGIETTRDSPKYAKGPNAESGGLFFQQRSNAAYALVNIAQHWRCTYDLEYAQTVYPLVRDVVRFWQDYLKFENGRYHITGDAIHEGSGQDINPIISLGLIRNALDLALDMSQHLDLDSDQHEQWKHILKHLSTWSTQTMKGKTVFRYTEKGTKWAKQHPGHSTYLPRKLYRSRKLRPMLGNIPQHH